MNNKRSFNKEVKNISINIIQGFWKINESQHLNANFLRVRLRALAYTVNTWT